MKRTRGGAGKAPASDSHLADSGAQLRETGNFYQSGKFNRLD
jgi:hypothetical protein